MVGFYPDPPGRRIPFDRDGSGVVQYNGTVLSTVAQSTKEVFNDEGNADPNLTTMRINNTQFVAVVFSAPMEIYGAYAASPSSGSSSGNVKFQYSLNTTTGLDGTWTDWGAVFAYNGSAVSPDYRTKIIASPGGVTSAVKGFRYIGATVAGSQLSLIALHIYGKRSTVAGNWLMLWHPTLNQPLSTIPAFYDLGDIPRGAGPQIMSFRVKNTAAALNANGVQVIREILTDGGPSLLSLTELRYNGGAYGVAAIVGNLAPGAISNLVDVKLDVTSGAPPGPWAPRLVAAATAWV